MIRQLDIPIYKANVLFLIEPTGEEWAYFCDNETNKNKITDNEIKYLFNEIATDNYAGTTISLDKGGYIVLIKQSNNPYCFTHELYHLIDKILKERNVEHSDNDEVYAYMIGWINEQYHQILKEFDEEKQFRNTTLEYDEYMDKECIKLCDKLNSLSNIKTTESCCGHCKTPYHIFFQCNDFVRLGRLYRCVNRNYSDGKWRIECCCSDVIPSYGFLLTTHEPFTSVEEMMKSVNKLIENINYWEDSKYDEYFNCKILEN